MGTTFYGNEFFDDVVLDSVSDTFRGKCGNQPGMDGFVTGWLGMRDSWRAIAAAQALHKDCGYAPSPQTLTRLRADAKITADQGWVNLAEAQRKRTAALKEIAKWMSVRPSQRHGRIR